MICFIDEIKYYFTFVIYYYLNLIKKRCFDFPKLMFAISTINTIIDVYILSQNRIVVAFASSIKQI